MKKILILITLLVCSFGFAQESEDPLIIYGVKAELAFPISEPAAYLQNPFAYRDADTVDITAFLEIDDLGFDLAYTKTTRFEIGVYRTLELRDFLGFGTQGQAGIYLQYDVDTQRYIAMLKSTFLIFGSNQ